MPKTPIFVSWSGPRAGTVAKALCDWLRRALQTTDPWCSPEIEAGDRWSTAVADRLAASAVGIICVTRENHAAPWLLFEAGALSKAVGRARVIPYFIGLKPTDIDGPLTQFQGKVADRADTYDLFRAVNASLEEPNPDAALADIFEMWWPKLESVLAGLPDVPKSAAPKRRLDEMVEEALSILRRWETTSIPPEPMAQQEHVPRELTPRLRRLYDLLPRDGTPVPVTDLIAQFGYQADVGRSILARDVFKLRDAGVQIVSVKGGYALAGLPPAE